MTAQVSSPALSPQPQSGKAAPGRVVAVLGPTNTGKTHLALERMMGHASGMIGFPLRLLARENYERVAKIKGTAQVALITGEERILPPHPRYFICTVESMPVDRATAFLAIDEIQLCADPERGHIFTDRLLHARGTEETMLLGADTIRPLIRKLVPQAEFIARPRLSTLSYAGPRKITRLPGRSAIVAFSAAEVYALAEMIRRQRGGAAVVLGALSPRARNAQVDLYQNGDVDYIVATDAIGMGLNMHVDHVAFAGIRKFDGRSPRLLEPSEMAQIAGRAGRHLNDGSFGTTDDVGGLDETVVSAIENHSFPPLTRLHWRNAALRLTGIDALLTSLDRPPDHPALIRAREADDHLALLALSKDSDIRALANHPDRVQLLWEICRVPDFRKSLAEQHHRLLAILYRHLCGREGRIPTDWMAAQVKRLDRTDGEIDSLMTRIANVRTWTYISHRPDWLVNPAGWQETTRALEDKLSDALHERLTQRFIDRRTAVLVRKMRGATPLESAVAASGQVLVEGQPVGQLLGLRFVADTAESVTAQKIVSAAAQRALRAELARRAERIMQEGDDAFTLTLDGTLLWQGAALARLQAGHDVLHPRLALLETDFLEAAERDTVRRRLDQWLERWLEQALPALTRLLTAELSGSARGLVWQLGQGLGSLPLAGVRDTLAALTPEERSSLLRLGLVIGHHSVFLPALLKPASQQIRAVLWSVWSGQPVALPQPPGKVCLPLVSGLSAAPAPSGAPGDRGAGRNAGTAPAMASLAGSSVPGQTVAGVSASAGQPVSGQWTAEAAHALGFCPLGALAVRLDILERLEDGLRQALAAAAVSTAAAMSPASASAPVPASGQPVPLLIAPPQPVLALLGVAGGARDSVLQALGWAVVMSGEPPAPRLRPPQRLLGRTAARTAGGPVRRGGPSEDTGKAGAGPKKASAEQSSRRRGKPSASPDPRFAALLNWGQEKTGESDP